MRSAKFLKSWLDQMHSWFVTTSHKEFYTSYSSADFVMFMYVGVNFLVTVSNRLTPRASITDNLAELTER